MHRGYIKLWRKIQDWEWYDDPMTMWFFIKLIFMANWEEKKWQGITIKAGQFVSSIEHLRFEYREQGKRKKLGTQTVRTLVKRLSSTGELTSHPTSHYTLFSIVNWKKYQSQETDYLTSPLTNAQQTPNKRLTTTKEVKALKNDKNKDMSSFEVFWNDYPLKVGKEDAFKYFIKGVRTEEDLRGLGVALNNYKQSERVKNGYIQNGSKWFRNWRDWVNYTEARPETAEERDKRLLAEICSK